MTGSSTYRLRKANRLLTAAAFDRVFEKPSRSRDKWFTVLCRDNNKDIARLGLAISRKHCRQATGRNRIRRIIRESFRQNQEQLAGLDIVILNQPAAAAAENAILFRSLDKHWRTCEQQRQRPGAQE